MPRRRFATRATALGSLCATVCTATTALAEPGRARLRVECAALEDEARAAVEARAEAELVSEPLPEGEVSVTCSATTATLAWAPKDGEPRERKVDLAADRATIEDAILAALHELLFEQAHPPPPPPPPVVKPVAPLEPEETTDEPPPPETPAPHRVRVAGIVGADAELWHGGISVALGAYTGIAISPWKRWTMSLVLAPEWGLGSTNGISAWGLRAFARVDYAVVSRVELGLGVSGRALWANATDATTSQLVGTTAGATLSARYVLPVGPIALSAGPRLELLARPIEVDFAGSEVFRVPTFVAGVTLDASAP
jgi:hypothetical protein